MILAKQVDASQVRYYLCFFSYVKYHFKTIRKWAPEACSNALNPICISYLHFPLVHHRKGKIFQYLKKYLSAKKKQKDFLT